jgi:hypothetical protein
MVVRKLNDMRAIGGVRKKGEGREEHALSFVSNTTIFPPKSVQERM